MKLNPHPLLQPRKTVLATGVFDILHLGHLTFLEESKKQGGSGSRLVVVVARDKTVVRRKGRMPIIPESQRRRLVAALRVVDHAMLGREEYDLLGILKQIKPNLVCVGYDQDEIKSALRPIIRRERLPVKVVQLRKFGPANLNSSSKLRARIRKAGQ